MNTHTLRDNNGKSHRVGRSSSRPGTYVEYKDGVGPMRLWMPGQFDAKSIKPLHWVAET